MRSGSVHRLQGLSKQFLAFHLGDDGFIPGSDYTPALSFLRRWKPREMIIVSTSLQWATGNHSARKGSWLNFQKQRHISWPPAWRG